MAYEPTVWESGDVVTSAKLNKLEQGVASAAGGGGGGVLIVHAEDNEAGTAFVLDKTWQEIKDASATSVVVLSVSFGDEFSYMYLFSCSHTTLGGEQWRVGFFTTLESYIFTTADGANAYPEMIDE